MDSKILVYRRKIIANFEVFLGNYLAISLEGKHLVIKEMVLME